MIKIKVDNKLDVEKLMNEDKYKEFLRSEEH